MDWQPIETAPKDGRNILIYHVYYDHGYYTECWWNTDGATEDKWRDARECDMIEGDKTHWMTLPKPPTTESRP
jgi:Protein of unknown function (DUF551)